MYAKSGVRASMASKDRTKYFRSRTKIGKLEAIAMETLYEQGHRDYVIIRDDRLATSFGCNTCGTWGCVETEDKARPIHGTVFQYRCGASPEQEVTQDGIDILEALYGSR